MIIAKFGFDSQDFGVRILVREFKKPQEATKITTTIKSFYQIFDFATFMLFVSKADWFFSKSI